MFFFPQQGRALAGGAPMGAGEGKSPAVIPGIRNRDWHRDEPFSSAGEEVNANQVISAPKLKAMLELFGIFLHAHSGMRFLLLLLLLWDCF